MIRYCSKLFHFDGLGCIRGIGLGRVLKHLKVEPFVVVQTPDLLEKKFNWNMQGTQSDFV